jgi:hypothetical protein
MSTYEGEHTIFGLLGQANLTQNDVLQFHPFYQRMITFRSSSCTSPLFVLDIFEIGFHEQFAQAGFKP